MDAERFYGDADGPELVIARVADDTPLPECRGWAYRGCGARFAERAGAEWCCIAPAHVIEWEEM